MIVDFRVRPPYGSFRALSIFTARLAAANRPAAWVGPLAPSVKERSFEMFREELHEAGVARAVVWGRAVQDQAASTKNEEVSELCARYPDTFFGFAGIAIPRNAGETASAVRELERGLLEHKLQGVTLEPGFAMTPTDGADDPELYPIYERCRDLGGVLALRRARKGDVEECRGHSGARGLIRSRRRMALNPASMARGMGTVLIAVGAILASEATAGESGYPNKPVRWIVPYAAGGPTDLVARLVGQKLAERWGQQIVVDIRPGANSIIGSEIVARAAPDGYTFLVALPAFAINPSVYRKLPYDTVSDFRPVIQIASAPYLVLVNPALPARSIRELVALAKARPGQLSFGSGGTASPAHLAMELLCLQANVRMEHVPYKGGAPALTDLMTGEIQVLINPALSSMPFVKAERLRILAVTSAKRSGLLPDVPTVAESGFPSYEVATWYGLFAPGKTPASIVQRVNTELAQVLRDPIVSKRLGEFDAAPIASSPGAFSGFVREEIAKWGEVVRKAGVRLP